MSDTLLLVLIIATVVGGLIEYYRYNALRERVAELERQKQQQDSWLRSMWERGSWR